MPQASRLILIGIGYRPLGRRAAEIVREAEVLLASTRLLEVFKGYGDYDAVKDRITVIDKVPDTISFIREGLSRDAAKPIVLLASGDPFFFGIGRRMIEEFGPERVTILPDLSSMQEAFARINVPWDDAFCISVHGGPDIAKRRVLPYEMSDIPSLLARHGKLAVLTDRQNNPAEIARIVLSSKVGAGTTMHVCQHLGYPDERIWTGIIDEAVGMTFVDPNVTILLQPKAAGTTSLPVFGIREDEIEHDRGMITKDEVRAVTLHKLRLGRKTVLWDIGAGSGSISIEAARLSPGVRVIAVEKETKRIETMERNILRFGITNIRIVRGSAPEALADLPAPDRVFIGGSAGRLDVIIKTVAGAMQKGIVAINAATIDTLQEGIALLEGRGFSVDVSEVSVSRSRNAAGKKLMNALNPVFIIRGVKGT